MNPRLLHVVTFVFFLIALLGDHSHFAVWVGTAVVAAFIELCIYLAD